MANIISMGRILKREPRYLDPWDTLGESVRNSRMKKRMVDDEMTKTGGRGCEDRRIRRKGPLGKGK